MASVFAWTAAELLYTDILEDLKRAWNLKSHSVKNTSQVKIFYR